VTNLDLALGHLIRVKRKRKKLTQGGFARSLGISQAHLSRVEAGTRPLAVSDAQRVNVLLKVDIAAQAERVVDIAGRVARMVHIPGAIEPVVAADLIALIAERMP
jgi:transcriptional regulator with XRE-family HTH domain